MNPRVATSIILAVALAVSTAAAPVAPGISVPNLSTRLAALDGTTAMPYFLLAEEVAAEIPSEDGAALARTLFVLAHEIDRQSPRPTGLAPSVYLALASIADREGERDWLLSLAGRTSASTRGISNDSTDATNRLLLAEAIGAARAGEGREVKELLAKPELQAAADRLRRSSASTYELLEDVQRETSCPICKNRRTMKSSIPREGGGNEEVHTLCPECRGNPGPRLTDDQFASTLRAESALLGAAHAYWSAQTWIDGGAPLRDPDPDDLAAYYKVDPEARRWIAQPDSPDPLAGRWWVAPSQ